MSMIMNVAAPMLFGALFLASAAMAAPPRRDTRAEPLSDEEAWSSIPRRRKGAASRSRPGRSVAAELPRSTAAFLQLDLAQRTKGPVAPKTPAAMRWVAAHANRLLRRGIRGGRRPTRRPRRRQARCPRARGLSRLVGRRAAALNSRGR